MTKASPAIPRPFSRFEFLIAWRYLRARRSEGGVSVMTWISLIGITLGVAALVATLAVRAGFRTEFVDTILGANAHSTAYMRPTEFRNPITDEVYITPGKIEDYQGLSAAIAAIPGVERAVPVVRGQAMVSHGERSNVVEVHGISEEDLRGIPRILDSDLAQGDLADFKDGIAIGVGIANELGLSVGDQIRLIAPEGAKTAFGVSPRVNAYEVTYIFSLGRPTEDSLRAYLPMEEAQSYFNREGAADVVEIFVADPEGIDALTPQIDALLGDEGYSWTWKQAWGRNLAALQMEDDVMFLIVGFLVLIAALNITSGLIMLVKNKGGDIGILRTMGLTEGSILRVFFICGAFIGVIGTAVGVGLGVLLSLNVSNIIDMLNVIRNGGVWQPELRGIYRLYGVLRAWDLARAVGLSLFLSFVVTWFPARRAARMNPVEALRYE